MRTVYSERNRFDVAQLPCSLPSTASGPGYSKGLEITTPCAAGAIHCSGPYIGEMTEFRASTPTQLMQFASVAEEAVEGVPECVRFWSRIADALPS